MRWIMSWLARLWSRTALTPVDYTPPAPLGHNKPPRQSSKKTRETTFGAYYYLDNVLDDLTDYFDALSLLKRTDPDGFAFYSKTGAQVVSRNSMFDVGSLPAVWTAGGERPAMGMVHITNVDSKKDDDTFHMNLISFTKFKGRPGIENVAGDIYEVTAYLRDYEWKKISAKKTEKYRQWYIRKYGDTDKGVMLCFTFHIAIDADGNVRALRERQRTIVRKDIPVTEWRTPAFLRDSAKAKKLTTDEVATELFRIVAGGSEHAASGVQVRAKRADGLCATFNVDMLRTPYFFRDRDKTTTENGRTKRIFHIARAHERKLSGGRTLFVRSHFRGERKFTWNGYRVEITMPGFHHTIWQRFTAAAYDARSDDVPADATAGLPEFAEMVDRHMSTAH